MYNNPYFGNYSSTYNPQAAKDRIENQIAELEKLKSQIPQAPIQPPMPANLTQNFQIAPNNQGGIKYANTIDEVNKEIVYADTPFFSKDLSVVWIKNVNGDIKSYELSEIIQKDEKDLKIEFLQAQIEELKKGAEKNESYANVDGTVAKSTKSEEPTVVSTVSKSKTKSK